MRYYLDRDFMAMAKAAPGAVREWLRRLLQWPKRTFADDAPQSIERPKQAQRARAQRSDVHILGEYYFRDAILDQLGIYFALIARMRKGDREAYDYFSKVGAHVLPAEAVAADGALSPWWTKTLPTVGGVMFCRPEVEKLEKDVKTFSPRALYFTKYKRGCSPSRVQTVKDGAVYVMTVYWDKLYGERPTPAPTQYPVVVEVGGQVRVLRTLLGGQTVQTRRGRISLPTKRWGIDAFFVSWARQHGCEPEEYLRRLFVQAANAYENVNGSMTRVTIRKAGDVAALAVNIMRMPYFFRDRDVRAEGGKKIFHIVRTHRRMLAGGRSTHVRSHFRGERKFVWNGYDVSVSVPGWHHATTADFNVGAIDTPLPAASMVGMARLGGEVSAWIDRGAGAFQRKPVARRPMADRLQLPETEEAG